MAGNNNKQKIALIGSLHHNPREKKISNKHMYNEIAFQRNKIKQDLAHHKMKVFFMIGGDFNAKHEI